MGLAGMGLTGLGRIGALGLLAALLTGCAAGAPVTVAPEAGDAAVLAVATGAPDPAAPTPTPTTIALSDAPTTVPTAAPPGAPAQSPTAPTTADSSTAGDETTAQITAPAAAADSATALDAADSAIGAAAAPESAQRVGFAQGVNQTLAPRSAASRAPAPEAADAGQAAPAAGASEPAAPAPAAPGSTGPPAAPAGAAQVGERPPAPAAPIDGMSLLVEGGSNGRPEVALTFDAGADRGYAEPILDLLRDEGLPATFGITGQWAEEHPDLIQRMVAEGHQLINHTWTHQSMTGVNGGLPPMTYDQLADELARTEQVVLDLTGYAMAPYYRPPYGDYSETTLQWLYELGYPFTIMWTCDSQGWKGWDAYQIFEYCTQVPLEDEVVLMHVGAGAAGDYEAMPLLIDHYRQQGHAFVTVEQMLQP